ncbi:MAG: Cytochrome oxidase biosis protein Sco1/SenC/PrrC, putative copper metallochaperone [Gammaproteobacteria bacterium]|nr:Cytochrome oxidase biosis protein Sco1/SenC/PrrC, putative copper metallochaperone [Gammaproteobacteria bacterium]
MLSRRLLLKFGAFLAVSCLEASAITASEPHASRDSVSMRVIDLPDVTMTRSDGQTVRLRQELEDGPPVILNFIFTSCPGICPMMSQVFAQLQRTLAAQKGAAVLVSISIDPEQDTPARLREYAAQFGPHDKWRYYTGTVEASESVQRAFSVYNGDKMSHNPVTFMHVGPGQSWQRVDGLATATELLRHYHALEARQISAAR